MNRVMMCGILALAIGLGSLVAQPRPKSKGEQDALMAAFSAQDPDTKIKASENVLLKYADTQFKPILLLMIAQSYQLKGDSDNTIIYGERVLNEGDPHNYQAKLLLAETKAQRIKEFDLNKDEEIREVEKEANGALEDLKTAQKPNPALPDDQWNAAKKDMTAQAHQALGMAALTAKKYDAAITEFKAAVDGASSPDPAMQVRLAAAYDAAGKYDESLAVLDKLMAQPDLNPTIRQFAQAERVRAMQGKGVAAKPAPPPAAPAPPAAPPAPKP